MTPLIFKISCLGHMVFWTMLLPYPTQRTFSHCLAQKCRPFKPMENRCQKGFQDKADFYSQSDYMVSTVCLLSLGVNAVKAPVLENSFTSFQFGLQWHFPALKSA